MAETWPDWFARVFLGDFDLAQAAPRPSDDELAAGGVFRVLKDFTMTRGFRRAYFAPPGTPNESDRPHLGDYHKDHDYRITPINAEGVAGAVEAGYAAILTKARVG